MRRAAYVLSRLCAGGALCAGPLCAGSLCAGPLCAGGLMEIGFVLKLRVLVNLLVAAAVFPFDYQSQLDQAANRL